MGLYLKKRIEEKPLTFSPKDGKDEAREKAGGEGSQMCVLIFYLPFEVPEGEDALEEIEERAVLSGPWEEISLNIYPEVFPSK